MYEISSDKELDFKGIKEELEKTMIQFLGELGYGRAGIILMDEWIDKKGIIKVNTKSVDEVKAALTMVEKINNQKVIVKTIGVSGILNKAKNKFIKGGR